MLRGDGGVDLEERGEYRYINNGLLLYGEYTLRRGGGVIC